MIRLFLLLLSLLAGSWFLADMIKQKGPGYAYIYIDQYSVETSFWFLLAALLLIVSALFFGLRVASYGIKLLIKTAVLPRQMGLKKSRKFHQTAVLAYLEQYWSKSYTDMAKVLKKVETPFIANLLMLQAHLKQGDIAAAELCYKQAETADDYDELSLLLANIDILLAKAEYTEAVSFCQNLLREYPLEMRVVLKALRVYQRQKNPIAMEPLIKTAKKHHLLTTLEIRQWQQDYYLQRFDEYAQSADWVGLKKIWRKAYKLQDRVITAAFYRVARDLSPRAELEKMLRQALRKHYSDDVVVLYAAIADGDVDTQAQTSFLQGLLSEHKDSAALLQALAVLGKTAGEIDKALDYSQQSLALKATSAAYQLQAELYGLQGHKDKQIESLKLALTLVP